MSDKPTNDQLSRLVFIRKLSLSMLERARDGEWERVKDLELRRQELLEQTFPLSEPVQNVDLVVEQIEGIRSLDKQTMELVVGARDETAGVLGKISTGRHAVSAYQAGKGK